MLYLLSLLVCWACLVGIAIDLLTAALPAAWAVASPEEQARVARTAEGWSPAPVTLRPALPTGLRVLPQAALASVDVRPTRTSYRAPMDPTDAPPVPARWRAAA